MKKLLIFLGLLTFSSNILCMQEKNSGEAQKQELTTSDKVKIGSALAGSAFFTWAVLFNYDARFKNQYNFSAFSWYHYPTIASILPTNLVIRLIDKYCNKQITNIHLLYNIVAGYTSLAALGLLYYACKKSTKPKQKENLE